MKKYKLKYNNPESCIHILKDDPQYINFIVEALDRGFSVRWPWPVTLSATKGYLTIVLYITEEVRKVHFYKGKVKYFDVLLDDFKWEDLKYQRAEIRYKDQVYILH